MWNRITIALLAAMIVPSTARAELVAQPIFSVAEQAIIHRNAALNVLTETDPWLVRRVLDVLAQTDTQQGNARDAIAPARRDAKQERPPEPERNPDLDYLGRSSPEAAHDLFQLIKRAVGTSKKPAAQ